MAAPGINKDHRKTIKTKYIGSTVLVGVGDTPQKPGRIGRKRLGLPSLALYGGVLANCLETAVQAIERASAAVRVGVFVPSKSTVILVDDAVMCVAEAQSVLQSELKVSESA